MPTPPTNAAAAMTTVGALSARASVCREISVAARVHATSGLLGRIRIASTPPVTPPTPLAVRIAAHGPAPPRRSSATAEPEVALLQRSQPSAQRDRHGGSVVARRVPPPRTPPSDEHRCQTPISVKAQTCRVCTNSSTSGLDRVSRGGTADPRAGSAISPQGPPSPVDTSGAECLVRRVPRGAKRCQTPLFVKG